VWTAWIGGQLRDRDRSESSGSVLVGRHLHKCRPGIVICPHPACFRQLMHPSHRRSATLMGSWTHSSRPVHLRGTAAGRMPSKVTRMVDMDDEYVRAERLADELLRKAR
jgi:hypothetical protein